MQRTRLLALLAIAMVAGLVVTGCKGPMDPTPKVGIASTTWILNPYSATYTIWAGQNQDAGTVTVKFDATNLYITYDLRKEEEGRTTGDWYLEETHAHVALSEDGIPHSNGGPIPGKFEFGNTFKDRVQTWTYTIPVKDRGWLEGKELYIATHCVVVQKINGKYTNRQTGWAGPYDYPGKNWAKYIKYRRFVKDVKLPDYTIHAYVTEDADPAARTSTFIVSLSGILDPPPSYDVTNSPTTYLGWCAEHDEGLLVGDSYDCDLRSSEDPPVTPNRPDIHTDRWDNVNYLLNHKLSGATAQEIQTAIWWLLTPDDPTLLHPLHPENGEVPYPLEGNAKVMYDEAMLYGEGWHPVPGAHQMLAVALNFHTLVIHSPSSIDPLTFELQTVFIEVDP